MTFSDLRLACPNCNAQDVVYSCEPSCCFNHVCSACLTSFQVLTHELGEELSVELPAREKESCAPTAACARCNSLHVYMLDEGPSANKLICASCHALLALDLVV